MGLRAITLRTVQGPPGPVAASVPDMASLAGVATLTMPEGALARVTAPALGVAPGFFTLLPASTATPNGNDVIAAANGGNWVRVPTLGTTTVATITQGAPTYAVLYSDRMVDFDSSGWTAGGAALQANLPLAPFIGERHSFAWFKWASGAPAPIVSAGLNSMDPAFQSTPTSGALATSSAMPTQGGRVAWEWMGTRWRLA